MKSSTRFGKVALGAAACALTLAACSKQEEQTADTTATTTTTTATTNAAAPAGGAAPAAAGAPAADNTDTVSGAQFASFTGDATAGETGFAVCKTCHAPDVNKIGPKLGGIVGRAAGTVADYNYTPANKNSGITWTPEKLFQYLENPQRVVPGTKMAFAGIPDPQKRADVIAYLGTLK